MISFRERRSQSSGHDYPALARRRAVCAERDILACFRLILGRNPSPEEWQGHRSLAGNELRGVVRNYVTSKEFAERRMLDDGRSDSVRLSRQAGFQIYADQDDLAVGVHVAAGIYEPHVTAVLRDTLRPGMHAVDIGANIGFFSMLAAHLVGRTGRVLGIEPNLKNVRMIEASRRANGFEHITVAACGVGRSLGLLDLNTSFSNGMTSPIGETLRDVMASTIVPCLPLSRLLPHDRRIDFIKIDVEGAEFTALHEARDLVARWRPTIVTEFSPGLLLANSGVSGPDYLTFLLDLGYEMAIVGTQAGTARPGIDRIMQSVVDSGGDHIDVLFTPARPAAVRPVWRRFLGR